MGNRTNMVDYEFTTALLRIMDFGKDVTTRNATTCRLRNITMTFDQTPLVTVRTTAWKNAIREMEWFLSGSMNINDLDPKVRHWWEPWADQGGLIQNNYSKQLRNFCGEKGRVDQIQYMIDTLKNHPNSRRNVITTWNTADMIDESTPITNCHGSLIQAFVEDGKLELTMYQRSADMVLGVPHNLIQYWALMHYLAHHAKLEVGSFTWIGGDCHIYPDHFDTAEDMIAEVEDKTSFNNTETDYDIPNLIYTPTSDEFKADDFSLDIKYEPLIKKSLKMTV